VPRERHTFIPKEPVVKAMDGATYQTEGLKQSLRILNPVLHRLAHLRNRYYFFLDVLILAVTPTLALWLRKDTLAGIDRYAPALIAYTLVCMAIRLPIFRAFGMYKRYWRYASVEDFAQILIAVLFSTVIIAVLFYGSWNRGIWDVPLPRSIPFINALITLLAVGGTRFTARAAENLLRGARRHEGKRVLIVGAGDAGQSLVRELRNSKQVRLCPVGFLDDDPRKHGLHIHNLPVFGGRNKLVDVVRRYRVAEVIIAMPSAGGKAVRGYLKQCEAAGIPAKTIPGMSAILGGEVTVSRIRNVEIEDLLRREPIRTDIGAVQRLIHGKRVLITGGGGSIGSELCRQVLQCEPSALAVLGHGENSVFEIHEELKMLGGTLCGDLRDLTRDGIQAIIADIRMPDRINSIMAKFQPHMVFHAAAHKHVPLMEANPTEAISNNVLGTLNVIEAARAANVARFVLISTDKAVNPTSVMGASKRVAELLVLRAAQQTGRPYVAVRFGNVLGSRGSVVPIFKQQIANGGPITVSHPEMKRYFMTIPEAVQLVLQASVLGKGGEIFMLDMGEPIRILDLARDLTELSGLEIGRDIDIVYTGVRPGEKLFEELFVPGECYQPTQHEKILIARNAGSFVPDELDEVLETMRTVVAQDDAAGAIACLHKLVPEYQDSSLAAADVDHAVVQQNQIVPLPTREELLDSLAPNFVRPKTTET